MHCTKQHKAVTNSLRSAHLCPTGNSITYGHVWEVLLTFFAVHHLLCIGVNHQMIHNPFFLIPSKKSNLQDIQTYISTTRVHWHVTFLQGHILEVHRPRHSEEHSQMHVLHFCCKDLLTHLRSYVLVAFPPIILVNTMEWDLRVHQINICSRDRCILEVHHWNVLQEYCDPTCHQQLGVSILWHRHAVPSP